MNNTDVHSFQQLKDFWVKTEQKTGLIRSYTEKKSSFIPFLLPNVAINLTVDETVSILTERFGSIVKEILENNKTINSPIAEQTDTEWIRSSNMVGINIRTINNIFNVVKYALTIPSGITLHNSLHLLPIWEPGVVGSLYAISSWNLNTEFYSNELEKAFPNLNAIDLQLESVINLLHLMGFAVGMDVIPHTDRFSEIVLSNPSYFEWIRRRGTKIIDHSNSVFKQVQKVIYDFAVSNGPSVGGLEIPESIEEFFKIKESDRNLILFGRPENMDSRQVRRIELTNILFQNGYETAPATMAPPYRGLKVKGADNETSESDKPVWRDYEIINPQAMSRVFGPLTRYKFYDNKDDNINWEVDFSKPNIEVFTYLQEKYNQIQQKFNFDFMRGDMSHVQMRSSGVPFEIDDYYDPLKAVKKHILKTKKYFGYFAESFLAPPNVMAYGIEIDHLEAVEAECVLGDLQSLETSKNEFLQKFCQYLEIKDKRRSTPSFTCITSDKDDPRFDKFYLVGNEFRYFIALFVLELPSYYSLGFEIRDIHVSPVENEYYTKLFVFQEREGPKKTSGSYIWGSNWNLFVNLVHIRLFAESIAQEIKNNKVEWLMPPDPTGDNKIICWILLDKKPNYLFIANSEGYKELKNISIPLFAEKTLYRLDLVFSIAKIKEPTDKVLKSNNFHYRLSSIAPNDVRVYKIVAL